MKYIDITQTITKGMERYPSDPSVELRQFKSLKRGNSCNLYRLSLGSHTGTHIDAPRHIFEKGKSVDAIKLQDFFCNTIVIDSERFWEKEFFKKMKPKKIKGALFKSIKDKVGLTPKEAEVLIENNIKVVGTEQMSIENPSDKSHPVHRLLLSNNVVIIENLNLKGVKSGYYKLVCLPLKIKNGDGAPARAILVYDKSNHF